VLMGLNIDVVYPPAVGGRGRRVERGASQTFTSLQPYTLLQDYCTNMPIQAGQPMSSLGVPEPAAMESYPLRVKHVVSDCPLVAFTAVAGPSTHCQPSGQLPAPASVRTRQAAEDQQSTRQSKATAASAGDAAIWAHSDCVTFAVGGSRE
jgi:hypothetical protein